MLAPGPRPQGPRARLGPAAPHPFLFFNLLDLCDQANLFDYFNALCWLSENIQEPT